ncbi:hypothetical protein WMY93_025540 [Mugilogobius chulae]|uniref:Uncharacterized protein n=1 Tax=Mugilogobius chulae TaxID=88201 RepID=A0AAW0MYF8_9GOBI
MNSSSKSITQQTSLDAPSARPEGFREEEATQSPPNSRGHTMGKRNPVWSEESKSKPKEQGRRRELSKETRRRHISNRMKEGRTKTIRGGETVRLNRNEKPTWVAEEGEERGEVHGTKRSEGRHVPTKHGTNQESEGEISLHQDRTDKTEKEQEREINIRTTRRTRTGEIEKETRKTKSARKMRKIISKTDSETQEVKRKKHLATAELGTNQRVQEGNTIVQAENGTKSQKETAPTAPAKPKGCAERKNISRQKDETKKSKNGNISKPTRQNQEVYKGRKHLSNKQGSKQRSEGEHTNQN